MCTPHRHSNRTSRQGCQTGSMQRGSILRQASSVIVGRLHSCSSAASADCSRYPGRSCCLWLITMYQCVAHETLVWRGQCWLALTQTSCPVCLWLMRCTAVQAAAPSGGPAEEEGVSPIALSNRLQTCLHSMAPSPESGATPLGPEAAARFLLAAHHPSTTMARARTDSVWYATNTSVLLTWDVSHVECKCQCLVLPTEHHW